MTLEEASFNNTLRTIAVLLIIWWLLRLLMRARTRPVPPGPQRPPGDVRIERPPGRAAQRSDSGIIDAEFEEIK